MTMFLIQSAILLAIAFIIGAIIGCLLKRMVGSESAAATATAATVATAAALAPRAAPVAAPVFEPKPEPIPAPVMAAPVAVAIPAPKPKAVQMSKAIAKPKAVAKPVKAAALAKPDDLKLIVGIGPVNERKLNALKIMRFAQIAAWTPKDETSYGEKLEFPGRIEREEWVRQAKKLAAGGKTTSGKSGGTVGLVGSGSVKVSKPAVSKAVASPGATAAKQSPAKVAPATKPIDAKLAKPIGGKPDNLTLIDGIGNVIEKKLHAMGVFHFDQMANWTEDQSATYSKAIGFPGRAKREGWVKQASIFAKGGTTDHAKKVESGQIKSSRISTAAEKSGKKK